jgi:hypothetical protein
MAPFYARWGFRTGQRPKGNSKAMNMIGVALLDHPIFRVGMLAPYCFVVSVCLPIVSVIECTWFVYSTFSFIIWREALQHLAADAI